jgi:hypothetical protein
VHRVDARFRRQLLQKSLEVRLVGVPVLHRLRLLRQFREDALEFVRRLAVLAIARAFLAIARAGACFSGASSGHGAGNGTAERATGQAKLHGPYWQWTAKVNGKTVTRRLSQTDAKLYHEWISNDRKLRKTITRMRQVAAKASELMITKANKAKV